MLLCFCSCKNEMKEIKIPENNPSITVYGNLHLVDEMLTDTIARNKYINMIMRTQDWLHESISENIILVEGFAFDKQVTKEYYMRHVEKETGVYPSEEYISQLLDFSKRIDIETYYILKEEKIVFGSENKERYDYVVKLTDEDINLRYSKELLDLRSEPMAFAAKTLLEINNEDVALIVGVNHLQWFKDNGYEVRYPPDYLPVKFN